MAKSTYSEATKNLKKYRWERSKVGNGAVLYINSTIVASYFAMDTFENVISYYHPNIGRELFDSRYENIEHHIVKRIGEYFNVFTENK